MKAVPSQARWIVLAALAAAGLAAFGYPPAPHHQLFGTVRDQYGNPLTGADAEVIFEAAAGRQHRVPVTFGRTPGVNYRLAVPMDSGVTPDLYQSGVSRTATPFRLRVRLGNATYLPIEMRGDFASLGTPGGETRLDLTLGEDSDGDGLPDAWELALIAARGGGLTLADIRPGDDLDGDGISNLAEYLAGTYAFDSNDGFSLALVEARGGRAVLEVFALRGRSYSVHGSPDLVEWRPMPFKVSGDAAAPGNHYSSANARLVRFEVDVAAAPGETARFFKLRAD